MSKQPPAKEVRTKWEVTIITTEKKEDAGSNKRIILQIEDMKPCFERYPVIQDDTHGPKNKIANWGKTVSQVICLVGFVASMITIYVFWKG